jgi:hypothetical protein
VDRDRRVSLATLRVESLTPDQPGWSASPLPWIKTPRSIARELAEVLVAGPWQGDDLLARGSRALVRRGRWFRPLTERLLAAFPAGPRPCATRVAAFLSQDPGFQRACQSPDGVAISDRRRVPPVMAPAPGAPAGWPVPAIVTPAALADRLGLDPGVLDWFADCQAREARGPDGPLRHYRYRWQAKRSGSARLVESPKSRLKAIQRALLRAVLDPIPPHDAAHGFRTGRSVRTHVAPHVAQPVVVTLDLCDFFPTITAARVVALFLTAGYPEAVARRFAGLCTNSVPADVWSDPACPFHGPDFWQVRRLYRQPHLPQGAPTSPALANLAAYRLDARLAGLAAALGARYTRYADDLAFSGGPALGRAVERVLAEVGAIALEEGFAVQHRKTRVMHRAVCQRVAGVVINAHPNVARDVYDTLKATLHNCVRHGPAAQNRAGHPDFRAHLSGRIAHVAMLNPARARRLQTLFERIAW